MSCARKVRLPTPTHLETMDSFNLLLQHLVHKAMLFHHWNPFKLGRRDRDGIKCAATTCDTQYSQQCPSPFRSPRGLPETSWTSSFVGLNRV